MVKITMSVLIHLMELSVYLVKTSQAKALLLMLPYGQCSIQLQRMSAKILMLLTKIKKLGAVN